MASTLTRFGPRPGPPSSGRMLPLEPKGFLDNYLLDTRTRLAEPYRGITTDGQVVPGLFAIQPSGASTRPIQAAAEAFLATLNDGQRTKSVFAVDDEAWRMWSNIHIYVVRHGTSLEEMTADQRAQALALLETTLSPRGYQTARDVMRLNEVLAGLTDRPAEFGQWLYWLSVFGTPSADAPWGWQYDGHHFNVNCFVLGDQVVMTPLFMGSEPTAVDSGPYAGTRVFEAEEQTGFALMRSLTAEQRARATIAPKVPREMYGTGFRDNFELRYEGVRYDQLSSAQQDALLQVIETYVGTMRPEHAAVKLAEVKQHLAETHFAWMGGCEEDDVFYYRVHSPVILIEFDHLPGVALDNDEPTRNHIHTVVRTPNGNDYGKDLLRQHRERTPHGH